MKCKDMGCRTLAISRREQFRTDFSDTFLWDVFGQMVERTDPRNMIGANCGISFGRASQIFADRCLGAK